MSKKLVIVESPAKARTIGRILSADHVVKASLGHVRDLPKKELGIDIENEFTPKYVVIQQRKKTIGELKKLADEVSSIYLATDPDREGEAISWHLVQAAKLDKTKAPIHRVVFHEITKEAVQQAFRNPRSIDMNLVDAQQARRLLDRLVGYRLSPLLWRKVQRGLSAGRVQSAAVRIIVDREREIQEFVTSEYWSIEAELARQPGKDDTGSFRALLVGLADGTKLEIPGEGEVRRIEAELNKAEYGVRSVQVKQSPRQPAAPFITSTLQQEAWRKLRFTASRTMAIAQQLYEGIPVGEEDPVGLITYMRTDSTHVALSAIAEARDFIKQKFGSEFLPHQPRAFGKAGRFTQEAHEAIRPTRIHREPGSIRRYLKPEQFKLYELIWKRMVASQMAAAAVETTVVEIEAKCLTAPTRYLLKATSAEIKFLGFMTLYRESKDEDEEDNGKANLIPRLQAGDRLLLLDLITEQHFTQPPPRYTEATLIKALEQKGIGRPSTYAPIISTIQERGYIRRENGKLLPEEMGFIVTDLLIRHFPKIVDLGFTAGLEGDLDDIAGGKKRWMSVLKGFYTPFEKTLKKASESIEKVNTAKMTDQTCPDCGRPMVIRTGRFGKFLACSGYPECKKTAPLLIKTGVPCPQCGRSERGELVERVGKKKRRFYGCSRYPDCTFVTNRKPIPDPCPECGKLLVLYREGWVQCTGCKYRARVDELAKVGTAA